MSGGPMPGGESPTELEERLRARARELGTVTRVCGGRQLLTVRLRRSDGALMPPARHAREDPGAGPPVVLTLMLRVTPAGAEVRPEPPLSLHADRGRPPGAPSMATVVAALSAQIISGRPG